MCCAHIVFKLSVSGAIRAAVDHQVVSASTVGQHCGGVTLADLTTERKISTQPPRLELVSQTESQYLPGNKRRGLDVSSYAKHHVLQGPSRPRTLNSFQA
jgi:hypothetical protein